MDRETSPDFSSGRCTSTRGPKTPFGRAGRPVVVQKVVDNLQKFHQKAYLVVLNTGVSEFVPKLHSSAEILGDVALADPPL